MFIGHFGVALAAKKAAPRTSLGLLFLAAQFIDLLWPALLLAGVEKVTINSEGGLPLTFDYYPISHSLKMVLLWAALFAAAYGLVTKNQRGALVLGACVLSHWLLDYVVHVPDLPIGIWQLPKAGLGLWNYKLLALLVETIVFAAGVLMYIRATRPLPGRSSFGLWALVFALYLIHLSSYFGPPPPSVQAVAWAGQLQWLFVLWAYWVDKRREVKITPAVE